MSLSHANDPLPPTTPSSPAKMAPSNGTDGADLCHPTEVAPSALAIDPLAGHILQGDDLAFGLGSMARHRPVSSTRSILQPARGMVGQASANEVVLGEPTRRHHNAMDAVIDTAVGVALETLLCGRDKTVSHLLGDLTRVAQEIESGRRFGRPEQVTKRSDSVLRDLERVARALPGPDKITAATWLAAGELMANDGSPPRNWDDAVDPDGVERGLLDADGRGTVLLARDVSVTTCADTGQSDDAPRVEIPPRGGGVAIPLPGGGRRVIGYDFQLNINAVRCRVPTESSDEFSIEGVAKYEADNLTVDRYEESPFEAVDPESSTGRFSNFLDAEDYNTEDSSLSTRAHRLFQVRVKFDPSRPTRLSAVFIPTEVELNNLQRMQVTRIFDALLDALVGAGTGALSSAAQAVPGVGQALAAIIGSDFVSNAIKRAVRPLVMQLIALFADPDRFTMYGLDLSFMWSDPSRVPLADYTVTGTGTNGFAFRPFRARVPMHPIDRAGRVTSFVPTFEVRPRRFGPGNYFTQFRSLALKTDFVLPTAD